MQGFTRTFTGRFALFAFIAAVSASAFAQPSVPIRTGVDATFAPHAMARLGGGIEGFNVDLAKEIARRLGRPVEIDATTFSGLIPGLNAKRYDWIAAPTTVTKERAENLLFTEGYLNTNYQFVTRKRDPDIKKLEDLKGKTISVNKGSAYEGWAKANADKYGFKYDVYDTNPDAVQAVIAGRAYANMTGNTVAAWSVKQNPATTKLSSYIVDTGLVWAVPFRKDDVAGRDQVSMALKCMKRDGSLALLHERWFGIKPPADSWTVKIAPGNGVPDMPGYDPKPVALKCD